MTDEMKEQAFDAHYRKGVELEEHGKYNEARDAYQTAMINNPQEPIYREAFERMDNKIKNK